MNNYKLSKSVGHREELLKRLADVKGHLKSCCATSSSLEECDGFNKLGTTEITESLIDLLGRVEEVDERIRKTYKGSEVTRYMIEDDRQRRIKGVKK